MFEVVHVLNSHRLLSQLLDIANTFTCKINPGRRSEFTDRSPIATTPGGSIQATKSQEASKAGALGWFPAPCARNARRRSSDS